MYFFFSLTRAKKKHGCQKPGGNFSTGSCLAIGKVGLEAQRKKKRINKERKDNTYY